MAKAKNTPSSSGDEGEKSDYKCPVTRRQIKEKTKALVLTVNGQPFTVDTKEYAAKDGLPGTLGWFKSHKMEILIDGVPCRVQCNLQFYIVKSSEADEE